jgi:pyruvate dehydrogenase kinase 2/3/4
VLNNITVIRTFSSAVHPVETSSSTTASHHINQWSLRSLVETNDWNDSEQMASLVWDIALRLQRQRALCVQLAEMVQELTQSGTTNPGGSVSYKNNQTSNAGNATTTTRDRSRVISTYSHLTPYWWKQSQQQQCEEELEKAVKNLKNLDRLHRDTHNLCLEVYYQLESSQLSTTLQTLVSTMKQINARHATTIEDVSELVIGLRPLRCPALPNVISEFLKGRLGVQLLCDHIVEISKGRGGAVTVDGDLSEIVDDAVTEAKHLCEAHFLTSPPVHIIRTGPPSKDLTATIVLPWLHYTLVELLKNSMAVTVERGAKIESSDMGTDDRDDETSDLCPLFISIDNRKDITYIHIHDQGGGFNKKKVQDPESLFEFAQCTRKWDRLEDQQQTYQMTRSPLRGLGVGLHMSRDMMRHFGGDLSLQERKEGAVSMNGLTLEKGCTATIALNQDLDVIEGLLPSTEKENL